MDYYTMISEKLQASDDPTELANEFLMVIRNDFVEKDTQVPFQETAALISAIYTLDNPDNISLQNQFRELVGELKIQIQKMKYDLGYNESECPPLRVQRAWRHR